MLKQYIAGMYSLLPNVTGHCTGLADGGKQECPSENTIVDVFTHALNNYIQYTVYNFRHSYCVGMCTCTKCTYVSKSS